MTPVPAGARGVAPTAEQAAATWPGEPPAVAVGADEFRAVFPAVPDAVPVARGYVRVVAGGCLAAGMVVELVASELASRAIRQAPGGVFTVAVWRRPGWWRVEVATSGSGWWPGGDGDDEVAYALGLVIVSALAERFGSYGVAGGTAVLWAEVDAGDGR